jgi:hypothetical protein
LNAHYRTRDPRTVATIRSALFTVQWTDVESTVARLQDLSDSLRQREDPVDDQRVTQLLILLRGDSILHTFATNRIATNANISWKNLLK